MTRHRGSLKSVKLQRLPTMTDEENEKWEAVDLNELTGKPELYPRYALRCAESTTTFV